MTLITLPYLTSNIHPFVFHFFSKFMKISLSTLIFMIPTPKMTLKKLFTVMLSTTDKFDVSLFILTKVENDHIFTKNTTMYKYTLICLISDINLTSYL